ncbi:ethanolamine ammonia-lyase light chain EutC [Halalkalicoccus subterraneus]|uniref:ethanolamine ammonia-lyase light chain EutC n=1 Tax=Halalkalicoccus subterraneus TaxID=2675002 RepID=UPI0034A1282E
MSDDHEEDRIDGPQDAGLLERITDRNPSRLGVGRAGSRPRTDTLLEFRADHGIARDAVLTTSIRRSPRSTAWWRSARWSGTKRSSSRTRIGAGRSPKKPPTGSARSARSARRSS